MKVLVTGFDPFGGEKVNPAYETVKRLDDEIEGAEIVKLELPTVFRKSIHILEEALEKEKLSNPLKEYYPQNMNVFL